MLGMDISLEFNMHVEFYYIWHSMQKSADVTCLIILVSGVLCIFNLRFYP